jgi:hypothetical protein
MSSKTNSLELSLDRLQIDNQLYNTPYPILLYPAPVKHESKAAKLAEKDHPEGAASTQQKCFKLTLVQNSEWNEVLYFPYFGILLQELDIRLDEVLLLALLDYASGMLAFFNKRRVAGEEERWLESLGSTTPPQGRAAPATEAVAATEHAAAVTGAPTNFAVSASSAASIDSGSYSSDSAVARPVSPVAPGTSVGAPVTNAQGAKMAYFELFAINPFKIRLSFLTVPMLANRVAAAEGASGSLERESQVLFLQQILASTGVFANIEGAQLSINALILEHAFGSIPDLSNRVTRHYMQQGLAQWYKILGNADFLGAPLSLVSSLGTGVYDFFYEPAQGLVSSPKDFGEGIAKGTSSLLKKSVFGVFNTATKITASAGKVLELASFDERFRQEREQDRVTHRPVHAGQGIARGLQSFGKGLMSGVTGLVEMPIEGAKEEGGLGLLKGIGKGLTGVVVKPVRMLCYCPLLFSRPVPLAFPVFLLLMSSPRWSGQSIWCPRRQRAFATPLRMLFLMSVSYHCSLGLF